MTQLLLIRHAVNDWVGEKRLAGWTPGVHLNAEGRRQAEALAQRLGKLELKAVYSSPLERTVETAEIIAEPQNLPVQVRDGVGEARYGEWTGQKLEDLAETDLWKVVQFYPSGAQFPGGEALREMQSRAVAEIDAICGAHSEDDDLVVVVSHSDVIKAIVAHYAGMHLDLFQRLVISPASLSVLIIGKMGPRIVRLNDTSHLSEEDTGGRRKTPDESARPERLSPEDYV